MSRPTYNNILDVGEPLLDHPTDPYISQTYRHQPPYGAPYQIEVLGAPPSVDSFTMADREVICDIKTIICDFIRDKIGDQSRAYNVVVAGGWFPAYWHSDVPNDIDFFVLGENEIDYNILCKSILIKGNDTLYKETYDESKKYISNNHCTRISTWVPPGVASAPKIQIILSKHKTRKELLDDCDFIHNTVSYTPFDNKLYITPQSLEAIKSKTLVEVRNRIPDKYRYDKFRKAGWTDTYTKLANDSYRKLADELLANGLAKKVAVFTGLPIPLPSPINADEDFATFKSKIEKGVSDILERFKGPMMGKFTINCIEAEIKTFLKVSTPLGIKVPTVKMDTNPNYCSLHVTIDY